MLEIRRLDADDWRIWRELRLQALEEAPAAFGSSLSDWSGGSDLEERWRARLADVAANFVAHRGGQPAGQASGARTTQIAQVQLISMWVAPNARGAGVGDALVKAVESWALEVSATSLRLSVKVDNDPAIGLYQRHGFARTASPVRDGEFEMAKRLS